MEIILKNQDYNLENVNVLVGETKTQLRRNIVSALNEIGLMDIEATGNLNKIHEKLAEGGLDLLICDTVLPEGDLRDLIKSVRFGETNSDPFMVIITLISDPTADLLSEMMEYGPDAILVKPFTLDQLKNRIHKLITHRKNFAVTSNYVGPERRKGRREDKIGQATIRVPNPLFNKSLGIEDLRVTKRAAKTAITRINNRIVEEHSQQIFELILQIFPALSGIHWTKSNLKRLQELQAVAFDLNRRISITDYLSLGGLTLTLNWMLKNVHNWTNETNKSDLKLLRILSDILQRGFKKSDTLDAELHMIPEIEIKDSPRSIIQEKILLI